MHGNYCIDFVDVAGMLVTPIRLQQTTLVLHDNGILPFTEKAIDDTIAAVTREMGYLKLRAKQELDSCETFCVWPRNVRESLLLCLL